MEGYKLNINLEEELLRSLAKARDLVKSIGIESTKASKSINSALRNTKQMIRSGHLGVQSIANSYKSAVKASSQYYQNLQKIKSSTKDIATARIQSLLVSGVELGAARTTGLFRKAGAIGTMKDIYPGVSEIQKRIQAGKLISATELYDLGKKSGFKFTAGMLDSINKEAKANRMNLSKMVAIEKATGKKIYSTIEGNVAGGFKSGMKKSESYLIRRLKSITSFFGIYAFARMGIAGVRTRIETEQAERTIAAILPNLGIKGDIRERLKFAKGEVQRFRREMTGLGVDPFAIQRPYMQYLAASKGTIETARREFSAFMLLAKVYNLNSEGIKGMTYALTQMKSKGKLSMEELSRQMGNQLPGAVKLFADAMGMSYDKMLKTIKTTGIDSQKAIAQVTEYAEKKFGSLGTFLTEDFGTSLQRVRGSFNSLLEALVSGTTGSEIKTLAWFLNKTLIIAKEFAPLISSIAAGIIIMAAAANKARILNFIFGASTLGGIKKMQGSMSMFGVSAMLAYGAFEMLFAKIRQLSQLKQVGGKGSGIQFFRDILPLVVSGGIAIGTTVKGISEIISLFGTMFSKVKQYGGMLKIINSLLKTQIALKVMSLAMSGPLGWLKLAGGAAAVGAVGYGVWKMSEARVNRIQANNEATGGLKSSRERNRFLDINMNLTGGVGDYTATVETEQSRDIGSFNFNNLLGNQI